MTYCHYCTCIFYMYKGNAFSDLTCLYQMPKCPASYHIRNYAWIFYCNDRAKILLKVIKLFVN